MKSERRTSARISVPYVVRIRSLDGDGNRFKEDTVVKNLSGGGLYVILTRDLPQGAEVLIAIRLATAHAVGRPALRLAARGTVLRVQKQSDGRYGTAIEFTRRRLL